MNKNQREAQECRRGGDLLMFNCHHHIIYVGMIVITIYTTVNKIIKIIMFYQEIAHSP